MAGRKADPKPALGSLTASQLAKALEVSNQAVTAWADEGCPSKGIKGSRRFNLAAVVNWRIKRAEGGRKAKAAAAGGDANDPDGIKAKTRVWRYKGDLLRLQLRKQQGKLLDAGEVTAAMAGQATDARLLLETLPDRVGLLISDEDVKPMVVEQVRVVVNGALRLLARGAAGAGGSDQKVE